MLVWSRGLGMFLNLLTYLLTLTLTLTFTFTFTCTLPHPLPHPHPHPHSAYPSSRSARLTTLSFRARSCVHRRGNRVSLSSLHKRRRSALQNLSQLAPRIRDHLEARCRFATF